MFSRHQRSSAMHYSQMTTGDYNFSRNILIKGLSIPLAGPMLGRHFTTNASKALKLQVLSNMRSNKPCRGFVFHHSSKTCTLGTFQRAGLLGLSIDLYHPRPSCLGRKAFASAWAVWRVGLSGLYRDGSKRCGYKYGSRLAIQKQDRPHSRDFLLTFNHMPQTSINLSCTRWRV
jgi:hypothetical protein